MSSRCRSAARAALVLAAAGALLAACQREARDVRGEDAPAARPATATTQLVPGEPVAAPPDPRAQAVNGNAYQISQGSRLFRWYNCNGCHANGGGGMGPPLMDDQWRYGGSIEQIYASIAQGRPNGMPAFGTKVPSDQIWQLAAYVRSLAGNAPSAAKYTRRDAMTSIPPRNQTTPVPPRPANPSAGQVPQP
jgi:cytochrome c oxidase cbb3-type subunit 3